MGVVIVVMKKIYVLLLFLVICILLCSCGIGKNGFDNVFESWKKENDSDVAIFDDRHDIVIVNGKKILLNDALNSYYQHSSDDLILCVIDNKIYGLHAYNFSSNKNNETVDLYSFDVETNGFEILYTSEFAPREKGEAKEYLSHTIACYNDGKILIYDGGRTVSYAIDSGNIDELTSDAFSYPRYEYDLEFVYDENGKRDYKSFKIKKGNDERTINIDYMAERSPYIKDLVDMGTINSIYGTVDPLEFFISGNSCVLNDKIYLVCRVLDKDGESSGLIFSYDYNTDQFIFIDYVFSTDYPKLFIVPNVCL